MPVESLILDRLGTIHRALDRAGFDHAVGGALALALHVGQARATNDIDLNVAADPQRPEELFACLPKAIEIHEGAAESIRRDGQVRLIWPDPVTPVDLFLPQHDTYHRLVNERAIPAPALGEGIRAIAATDLIVFKALFNRPKDWVDIAEIVAAGNGDLAEARQWVGEFTADQGRLDRLQELIDNPPNPDEPIAGGLFNQRRIDQ